MLPFLYALAVLESIAALYLALLLWRAARETFTMPPGEGIAYRRPMLVVYALAAFLFAGTDLLNFRNGAYEEEGAAYLSLLFALFTLVFFLLTLREYRAAR